MCRRGRTASGSTGLNPNQEFIQRGWSIKALHKLIMLSKAYQQSSFENPDYLKNDANRCFHCKDELFDRLEEVGRERGIEHIVYGVNMDDLGDYRPGQNAAKLHRVKAPLVDAKLSKAEPSMNAPRSHRVSRYGPAPTYSAVQ